MNKIIKKNKLSTAVAAALLIGSTAVVATPSEPTRNPTDKPNVIIVYLDDAGYADISINGGEFPTPHIDKLAREGKNFDKFYVNSPISSPSRAGLLTSRLENHTGMYGDNFPVFFEDDPDGLPKSEVTIATMLKDHGYNTAMLGKWHLGIGVNNSHLPTRHGFQEWWGIPTSNDMFYSNPRFQLGPMMELMASGNTEAFSEAFRLRERILYTNDETGVVNEGNWHIPVFDASINEFSEWTTYNDFVHEYMDQVNFQKNLTNRAVSYIKENKDDPFFLYIAPPQNHVPLFMAPEFQGVTATPYGDVMMEIDWSIGEIEKAIKESGIEDNTIVIFSSDNGPWLRYAMANVAGDSGPYRDGKNATYEGGVSVPGVIKWPGQIKPSRVTADNYMSNLDIMPTIATMTGASMPSVESDGIDVSGLLLKDEKSPRTMMPYYAMGKLQAYRSGDYKVHFVTSGLLGRKELKTPELYNLKNDIGEKHDLAAKEPAMLKQIVAEAKAYDDAKVWVPGAFDFGKQQ